MALITDLTPSAESGETEPSPAAPGRVWDRLVTPMPADRLVGWIATLAVTGLAAFLSFYRLAVPSGKIFDEVYYAKDAHDLLLYGVARNADGTGPGFVVHPPLGKWAIAGGQALFGNDEFGWRFAAAVAGSIAVLVLIRVARRMTGSTILGVIAGLLLTFDGLHFVQSRVAMLDIFLMTWLVAGFACLVADRDDGRRRLASRAVASDAAPSEPPAHRHRLARRVDGDAGGFAAPGPRLGIRWWRIAAGVCLGAAVASKWSGLYYVAAFGLMVFAWEVGSRRAAGIRRPFTAALRREAVPLLLALIVIPIVVYAASYTGWFASGGGWDRHWADGRDTAWPFIPDAVRSLWHYQGAILDFHTGLSTPHRYQSHPLGWLVQARPVAYFYTSPEMGQLGCQVQTCSREVLGIGTPALWWSSLAALAATIWMWASRRDWRAAAVLVGVAAGILPWIPSDLNDRTMFQFYALPALPFLCLALTLCAGWALGGAGATVRRRRGGAIAVGVVLALVVVNFFYLYPILTAQVIPYDAWHARMWFGSWI